MSYYSCVCLQYPAQYLAHDVINTGIYYWKKIEMAFAIENSQKFFKKNGH